MQAKYLFYSVILFFTVDANAQFGFNRTTDVNVVNGAITQKYPWAGGMDFCQFSTIDLDFDGTKDLFVFDRTCNKVLTFLQKGAPGEVDYEYAPEYEALFPAMVDWVLLVDYNCDGLEDIFTSRLGGIRVWENTGNAADGHQFEIESAILTTFIYGSTSYQYVNSVDIPAIVDVDGDGDKDILSFGVPGTTLEYRKNRSMELYGTCDSLVFETKNICWGRFKENGATNEVSLWDTLVAPCTSDDLTDEFVAPPTGGGGDRHAGSSVLALDMTNSGVMDLIIGDVSYNNLTLLLNSGTEVNTNSGMNVQISDFPSEDVAVDIPVFPAAFHVDINNDAIRDLLVAPASRVGSENRRGVWYYENEGADTEPDFIFQEDAFLQGEMIDVGTSSLPVFFDHNGDGLKDLLVSQQNQYVEADGSQASRIAYYENTGTATEPEYTFITADYQNFSALDIGASLNFYPSFGDLDGDGDEDMILGEYLGYCYYMENTGGAGSPAVFNTFALLSNSDGDLIFDGTFTYPNLVDIDRDGDQDLIVGKRNGKLAYYNNTGVGDYNFEFVTGEFGGVDVSGESIEGYAVTQFVDVDGEYQLIVGSKKGDLYYYDDIEANLDGAFHLVDVSLDNINIGTYSAPAVANITDDNRFELILGNRRGGLGFYTSAPTSLIGVSNLAKPNFIKIYPNPAQANVTVDLGKLTAKELSGTIVQLFDLTGKLVFMQQPTANSFTLNTTNLAKGTYLVKINGESIVYNEKLIVE